MSELYACESCGLTVEDGECQCQNPPGYTEAELEAIRSGSAVNQLMTLGDAADGQHVFNAAMELLSRAGAELVMAHNLLLSLETSSEPPTAE